MGPAASISGGRGAFNAWAPNAPSATAAAINSAAATIARRGVIFDYTNRPNYPPYDSTMTIERRNVGKRLSDLVIYAPPPDGRLVYLAGQVAEDASAAIDAQTRSLLRQIDRLPE